MSVIFSYDSDTILHPSSDDFALGSDLHTYSRISENMAMDLETGELHFVSSWPSKEKENNDNKKRHWWE